MDTAGMVTGIVSWVNWLTGTFLVLSGFPPTAQRHTDHCFFVGPVIGDLYQPLYPISCLKSTGIGSSFPRDP